MSAPFPGAPMQRIRLEWILSFAAGMAACTADGDPNDAGPGDAGAGCPADAACGSSNGSPGSGSGTSASASTSAARSGSSMRVSSSVGLASCGGPGSSSHVAVPASSGLACSALPAISRGFNGGLVGGFPVSGVSGGAACVPPAPPALPPCTDDAWEPNNDLASARQLDVTGTLTLESLKACADARGAVEDWFKVSLHQGEGVRVSVQAASADTAAFVSISDDSGQLGRLDQDDPAAERAGRGIFDADTEVYIRASATAGGTYSLVVERIAGGTCIPDAAEPDDTDAAATVIGEFLGFRVGFRSACAGDVDHFRFTAPAGVGTETLRVAFPTGEGALDAAVYLAGQPQAVLSTQGAVAGGVEVTFPASEGADYVLRVAFSGTGHGVSRYSVWPLGNAWCRADSAEPNDAIGGAPLLAHQQQQLRACAGDVDIFALPPLANDQPARVRISSTVESGTPVLSILDASGGAVAAPQGPSLIRAWPEVLVTETTWSFTGTPGATYYARVARADPAGQLEYELGRSGAGLCAAAHPGASLAEPAPLQGYGSLCEFETRYHALPLAPAGPRSRVWGSLDPAVSLRIVDGAGSEIAAQEERTGFDVSLRYTTDAVQPYFLEARNQADAPAWYGLDAHGGAPANDRCADAVPVVPGSATWGSTADADDDVTYYDRYAEPAPDVFYSVEVPAGATLQAALEGCADLAVWLVEGCSPACTWAGVDRVRAGQDETLVFTNPVDRALPLLLVVDGQVASQRGPFRLDVQVR